MYISLLFGVNIMGVMTTWYPSEACSLSTFLQPSTFVQTDYCYGTSYTSKYLSKPKHGHWWKYMRINFYNFVHRIFFIIKTLSWQYYKLYCANILFCSSCQFCYWMPLMSKDLWKFLFLVQQIHARNYLNCGSFVNSMNFGYDDFRLWSAESDVFL